MAYVWNLWVDVIVGMAGAVVVVPVVFYLVQWRDAQALRATGLNRRETLVALWRRFESAILRKLNEYGQADTCLVDDCVNPPRTLPDPIPEGAEVMFSEMVAGRGLYCVEHFDLEEPADG